MPWLNDKGASKLERVIAGFCYLTFGLIGLLFIIISGQRGQSSFFRFHFLQSIVLGIIFMLIQWCSGILVQLLLALMNMIAPLVGGSAATISVYLFGAVDIFFKAYLLLFVYGMIWAFMGKLAEIPLISDIIRRQM